jgi:hypothetical protein
MILRYRTGSISNVTTFDIEVYHVSSIRYRMSKHSILSCNIVPDISVSISKVSLAILGYNDIEGPTFDIEGRQGSRCPVCADRVRQLEDGPRC